MILPPLLDQIRIAETLDKVKGIIDARKKQIEKLDEYIKSVFYTMFGDPIANSLEAKEASRNWLFGKWRHTTTKSKRVFYGRH